MTSGKALIRSYVENRYISVDTGKPVQSPIRRIEIHKTTQGIEKDLLAGIDLGSAPAVISDENTHDVIGARVARAINASEIILDHPKANDGNAAILKDRARHATSLIAGGSGTLNDLAKYVGHQTGRLSATFATAPSMNGYTTSTVSIDREGFKLSLPAQAPSAVIFDLEVLSRSPVRMIRAGVADAICRSTAQVDWLLSHNLLDTDYFETPFDLQLADEKRYLDLAPKTVTGDLDAMEALTIMLILGGLGALTTGSSHSGSMGEHGLSHYIDMFASPHPGSLHGEQIGIATLSMARLQQYMLNLTDIDPKTQLPIDEAGLEARYGIHKAGCITALHTKNNRIQQMGDFSARTRRLWPQLRPPLTSLLLDPARIEAILKSIGAATKPDDIGLDPAFYNQVLRYGFEIRDRFCMFDLALMCGELDTFISQQA